MGIVDSIYGSRDNVIQVMLRLGEQLARGGEIGMCMLRLG